MQLKPPHWGGLVGLFFFGRFIGASHNPLVFATKTAEFYDKRQWNYTKNSLNYILQIDTVDNKLHERNCISRWQRYTYVFYHQWYKQAVYTYL